MKKLLFFITVALLLGSCKQQEVDLVFGTTPELRIKDTLTHIKSALVGAENGWIAYTSTVSRGGYGFFMEFYENDRLSMVADLNNTTATEAKESTYRVRQIMAPTLSFDTYNYITIPQDPLGDNNGGTNGDGLQSDIEFEYIRTSGDSLIFQGRKYDQDLVLIKATTEDRQAYFDGTFGAQIIGTNTFFQATPNPNITLTVGGFTTQVQISVDGSNKNVSFSGLREDGTVATISGNFYYTLEGIGFNANIGYEDMSFSKIVQRENSQMSLFDSIGNEYMISASVAPILPLHKLLGVQYNELFSEYQTIYPGTSVNGAEILSYFHDNVSNQDMVGFSFDFGYLQLHWNTANKRMEVRGASYQLWNDNNNPFITTIVYDYTDTEDGVYTFSLRSGPSGGYVSSIMEPFHEFLLEHSLKLDYHVDGTNLYGMLSSVSDPSLAMTFLLR